MTLVWEGLFGETTSLQHEPKARAVSRFVKKPSRTGAIPYFIARKPKNRFENAILRLECDKITSSI